MAETPLETIGRRYQLRRKLGEGGMGAVYVVYDRLMKQDVALKRVLMLGEEQAFAAGTNAEDFHLALAREFKVLAGLRHPHIISVLDYGFEEGDEPRPYFTMELLRDARSFSEALTQAEEIDKQVGLFVQLLQALAYLHRCGILHRDLKPGNVMVMPDGQVKVLDFGLAGKVLAEGEEFGGTLLYISPELLTGGNASKASDLYAVGVMLYELIAGKHPLYNNDYGSFIEALLTQMPDLTPIPDAPLLAGGGSGSSFTNPSADSDAPNVFEQTTRISVQRDRTSPTKPTADNLTADADADAEMQNTASMPQLTPPFVKRVEEEDIPDTRTTWPVPVISAPLPTLRGIIGRLLQKDPAERYHDAYALINELCAAVGIASPQESAAIRESFLQAATFVGREHELSQLTHALNALNPDGNEKAVGAAWLVGGESGVGKSRLLDELRIRAATQGVLVMRGQAVAEGGVPYQAWRDPLRRLVLSTDLDDLDAGILKSLIPDMDELLGRRVKKAAALSGPDTQKRLVGAIASLFARQSHPMLLLLEDLQWASGAESLDVLRAVVGLCAERPLLIVGSFRLDETPDLAESLAGMRLMRLERLPAESVAELSASMLGEVGRQSHILELLQRESAGNAFFMVEIARALAEEAGRLGAVGTRQLPHTIFAGGIQHIIKRRLDRVPAEWQPLLRLAAIVGREIDQNIMGVLSTHYAAAGEMTDPTGANVLQTFLTICANCAVLEVEDEQWSFSHDRLREVALQSLDGAALADLHRQVAEAIETAYPDDPQQASALTRHWHAAGNTRKEFDAARLAGSYGLQMSTFAAAAEHLERALELLPIVYPSSDDVQSRRYEADLLTQLGETRYYTGEYVAAATCLRSSLDLYRELEDRSAEARVLVLMGDVFWRQSEYAEAAGICETGLQIARAVNDGENASRALNRLGMLSLEKGDFAEATRYLEESHTVAKALDNPALLVSPTNNLGVVAYNQGDYARSKQRLEETLALCQAVGERSKMATILSNLGSLAGSQQDFTSASDYFERSLAISRAIGDRHSQILALNNLGSLAEILRRYADADTYLRESIALCEAIGNRRSSASTHVLLGNIMRLQGITDEAASLYKRALKIALEIDALPSLMDGLTGLSQVIDDKRQAMAWLGMILHHPATFEGTREQAEAARQAVAEGMTPEAVDASIERGKTLDPKRVATEIVA